MWLELQPSVIFIDEMIHYYQTVIQESMTLFGVYIILINLWSIYKRQRQGTLWGQQKTQDLDDAVLRRMEKRIYIPLPDEEARKTFAANWRKNDALPPGSKTNTAQDTPFDLNEEELDELVVSTEGYSCSDIVSLCREASLGRYVIWR